MKKWVRPWSLETCEPKPPNTGEKMSGVALAPRLMPSDDRASVAQPRFWQASALAPLGQMLVGHSLLKAAVASGQGTHGSNGKIEGSAISATLESFASDTMA